MKQSFLLLAALIFVLGCKKYEAEYAVSCQFPASFFFSKRILLVTNAEGEVLHKFDIPEGASSFSEVFTYEGKEVSDHYDLHLLDFNSSSLDTVSDYVQIYSHFDIPNGASVYLFPAYLPYSQSFTPVFFKIQGIESYDTLRIEGGLYDYFGAQANLDPAQKLLTYFAYRPTRHGLVLRLRANGETSFRHLYLPENTLKDTTTVSWQDFKPENKPRAIKISVSPVNELEVVAISPDQKQLVALKHDFSWLYANQDVPLQFNHPEGLDEHFSYRVMANSYLHSFDKIFQPGETIRFDPPDITFSAFSIANQKVLLQATGDIDLLRIEQSYFNSSGTGGYIVWQMDGAPTVFQNRALPNLDAYLPGWYKNAPFLNQRVGAYQIEAYDYPQVREGFPFKSTEPYAVARSGFKAIWKLY